jgi:uncharacterized protein (DUF362 family)
MNRREFFQKIMRLTGAVLFAPLLESCASPAPSTEQPTQMPTDTPEPVTTQDVVVTSVAEEEPETQLPEEEPERAAVALINTQDRADGIRSAMALLGINPVRGKHVLLKPNFNSAAASPGSTHPDVLRTLLVELTEMGAASITIGDRSGMGNTRSVMQQIGVFDLAAEFGTNTVVFNELAAEDWVIQQLPGHHWARGYAVPRMLVEAECVVQTCNLKTHRYGGHFTLSLKNSVGFAAKTIRGDAYDYMQELHSSGAQRAMIAEINTSYTPALIVMDGIAAFVDGGPDVGTTVASEVVLAGTDRVAIDAVGVAILRMFGTTPEVSQGTIFEQEQIARAVELGLGIDSPDKIDIITDDPAGEDYAARVSDVLLQ